MPIVRDFTYEEDHETGSDGLKPSWFDNANPTSGQGVAHDMLEHFANQSDPIAGELQAIGAVMALRWENGEVSGSDVTAMAYSISQCLTDLCWQNLSEPAPARSRRLSDDYSYADDVIVAAVVKAWDLALAELADHGGVEDVLTPTVRVSVLAHVRRGYRKAQRRYAHADLYTVGICFFKQVQARVDKLLSNGMLALGDKVRVSLDARKLDINIRVNGRCAHDWGYL